MCSLGSFIWILNVQDICFAFAFYLTLLLFTHEYIQASVAVIFSVHSCVWQDLCNGRGWCSCGQCSCFPPFFGTYCELCSGSNVCIQGTCDISGPNGICTGCAVGFLEVFHANNVTVDELLSEAFVQIAIRNGTLPPGTVLGELNGEKAIFLPETFSAQCNRSCTPLVIINQTLNLEYDIQGQWFPVIPTVLS